MAVVQLAETHFPPVLSLASCARRASYHPIAAKMVAADLELDKGATKEEA